LVEKVQLKIIILEEEQSLTNETNVRYSKISNKEQIIAKKSLSLLQATRNQ
jgi:hypothetical protein